MIEYLREGQHLRWIAVWHGLQAGRIVLFGHLVATLKAVGIEQAL